MESTESKAGENVEPSPTELLPEDRATGATVDPSPEPDASGQAADDPSSGRSADDGTADDAVETVSVPSLAVDGHPAIYHENDGADTDGWPEDRNLAGRSPSDD